MSLTELRHVHGDAHDGKQQQQVPSRFSTTIPLPSPMLLGMLISVVALSTLPEHAAAITVPSYDYNATNNSQVYDLVGANLNTPYDTVTVTVTSATNISIAISGMSVMVVVYDSSNISITATDNSTINLTIVNSSNATLSAVNCTLTLVNMTNSNDTTITHSYGTVNAASAVSGTNDFMIFRGTGNANVSLNDVAVAYSGYLMRMSDGTFYLTVTLTNTTATTTSTTSTSAIEIGGGSVNSSLTMYLINSLFNASTGQVASFVSVLPTSTYPSLQLYMISVARSNGLLNFGRAVTVQGVPNKIHIEATNVTVVNASSVALLSLEAFPLRELVVLVSGCAIVGSFATSIVNLQNSSTTPPTTLTTITTTVLDSLIYMNAAAFGGSVALFAKWPLTNLTLQNTAILIDFSDYRGNMSVQMVDNSENPRSSNTTAAFAGNTIVFGDVATAPTMNSTPCTDQSIRICSNLVYIFQNYKGPQPAPQLKFNLFAGLSLRSTKSVVGGNSIMIGCNTASGGSCSPADIVLVKDSTIYDAIRVTSNFVSIPSMMQLKSFTILQNVTQPSVNVTISDNLITSPLDPSSWPVPIFPTSPTATVLKGNLIMVGNNSVISSVTFLYQCSVKAVDVAFVNASFDNSTNALVGPIRLLDTVTASLLSVPSNNPMLIRSPPYLSMRLAYNTTINSSIAVNNLNVRFSPLPTAFWTSADVAFFEELRVTGGGLSFTTVVVSFNFTGNFSHPSTFAFCRNCSMTGPVSVLSNTKITMYSHGNTSFVALDSVIGSNFSANDSTILLSVTDWSYGTSSQSTTPLIATALLCRTCVFSGSLAVNNTMWNVAAPSAVDAAFFDRINASGMIFNKNTIVADTFTNNPSDVSTRSYVHLCRRCIISGGLTVTGTATSGSIVTPIHFALADHSVVGGSVSMSLNTFNMEGEDQWNVINISLVRNMSVYGNTSFQNNTFKISTYGSAQVIILDTLTSAINLFVRYNSIALSPAQGYKNVTNAIASLCNACESSGVAVVQSNNISIVSPLAASATIASVVKTAPLTTPTVRSTFIVFNNSMYALSTLPANISNYQMLCPTAANASMICNNSVYVLRAVTVSMSLCPGCGTKSPWINMDVYNNTLRSDQPLAFASFGLCDGCVAWGGRVRVNNHNITSYNASLMNVSFGGLDVRDGYGVVTWNKMVSAPYEARRLLGRGWPQPVVTEPLWVDSCTNVSILFYSSNNSFNVSASDTFEGILKPEWSSIPSYFPAMFKATANETLGAGYMWNEVRRNVSALYNNTGYASCNATANLLNAAVTPICRIQRIVGVTFDSDSSQDMTSACSYAATSFASSTLYSKCANTTNIPWTDISWGVENVTAANMTWQVRVAMCDTLLQFVGVCQINSLTSPDALPEPIVPTTVCNGLTSLTQATWYKNCTSKSNGTWAPVCDTVQQLNGGCNVTQQLTGIGTSATTNITNICRVIVVRLQGQSWYSKCSLKNLGGGWKAICNNMLELTSSCTIVTSLSTGFMNSSAAPTITVASWSGYCTNASSLLTNTTSSWASFCKTRSTNASWPVICGLVMDHMSALCNVSNMLRISANATTFVQTASVAMCSNVTLLLNTSWWPLKCNSTTTQGAELVAPWKNLCNISTYLATVPCKLSPYLYLNSTNANCTAWFPTFNRTRTCSMLPTIYNSSWYPTTCYSLSATTTIDDSLWGRLCSDVKQIAAVCVKENESVTGNYYGNCTIGMKTSWSTICGNMAYADLTTFVYADARSAAPVQSSGVSFCSGCVARDNATVEVYTNYFESINTTSVDAVMCRNCRVSSNYDSIGNITLPQRPDIIIDYGNGTSYRDVNTTAGLGYAGLLRLYNNTALTSNGPSVVYTMVLGSSTSLVNTYNDRFTLCQDCSSSVVNGRLHIFGNSLTRMYDTAGDSSVSTNYVVLLGCVHCSSSVRLTAQPVDGSTFPPTSEVIVQDNQLTGYGAYPQVTVALCVDCNVTRNGQLIIVNNTAYLQAGATRASVIDQLLLLESSMFVAKNTLSRYSGSPSGIAALCLEERAAYGYRSSIACQNVIVLNVAAVDGTFCRNCSAINNNSDPMTPIASLLTVVLNTGSTTGVVLC